jgi:dsDNA-binding SOS-regulon protein
MSEKLEINIIYAEEDNKPIMEDRGWVSYFEKFLYMMLNQTMNREITVNLISDIETKELSTQGIYIPILSPDFILSGGCLDRIENLFLKSESNKIHDLTFPVFKSPLLYVDIPEKLKPLRSYIFYLDNENREEEVFEFFSKEAEKGYWMKMVDLCFDIYETILGMNAVEKDDLSHGRKAVYLAETGQDLFGARNIIKRELTRHGYEVFPKAILPHASLELKKSTRADLSKCQFSIHMIGSSYGAIPKGSESSVMDIQNNLAAEHSQANPNDFNRLIWISPTLKYASEKQKAFIHNIKRDDKASFGAEVLQTSLEDFKNTLWEELLDKGLNKKLRNSSAYLTQDKAVVYLIFDEIDAKAVQPVKKEILQHDVELITLDSKGELMDLRNKHIDSLKQMNGAIVFQENVNKQWVYMKLLDLLKAPGFGRSKPVLGKLFKSSKAKGVENEYISRYEVEVDASEGIKNVTNFISRLKLAFQDSQSKMTQES